MAAVTYAEAKPAAPAYAEPARRMTLNGWAVVVIFLPPALLLFTVFVFLPIVEAGWYSFFNWNGYGPPEKFIGLKNYGYLFSNPTFTRSLVNNGLIIVFSLLVQLPLALAVAVMVAGRAVGAVWFRMIFFLPYVLAHCRCRAHLALYVRRRLRDCRARSPPRSASPPYFLLATRLGRSRRC